MIPDFDKWFELLDKAPPWLLLTVFTLITGYALKRAEYVNNRRIPLILISVGGPLYLSLRYGWAPFILKGCIIAGAVGLFHKYVIRYFEDKYPWLKKLLVGAGAQPGFDSDPQAFVKGDTVLAVGKVETSGKAALISVEEGVMIESKPAAEAAQTKEKSP